MTDAVLDFILRNCEDLLGNVKAKCSFGCRDHDIVAFRTGDNRRNSTKGNIITLWQSLHCHRTEFYLFRNVLRRVPISRSVKEREDDNK